MSSLTLDRPSVVTTNVNESKLALRFVLGLCPALMLMGAWGDYARSVMIGDELTPEIAQTAARALQAGPNSYASFGQDLSARLSARSDLTSVDVSMKGSKSERVTVNVQAQVPSIFLPQLVPSYNIERSSSACVSQNSLVEGSAC